jgi:hypothetical protein
MLRYAASERCTCWNRAGVVSFSGRKGYACRSRASEVLLWAGWLTDSVSEGIFCGLSCLACAFLG